MSAAAEGDAREHPRATARVKVEYHYGSTTGVGHTMDISEGGLLLLGKCIAEPGTRIYLRLYLPGSQSGDPLKMIGIVTRAVAPADNEDEAGMGIHFEVAYARTRDALSTFIDDLRSIEAGDRPSIHPVPGATDESTAYAARFPSVRTTRPSLPSGEEARPMTADEVNKAFAFDAQNVKGVRWGRIGSIALRLFVILLVIAIAGAVFRCVGDLFTGSYSPTQ